MDKCVSDWPENIFDSGSSGSGFLEFAPWIFNGTGKRSTIDGFSNALIPVQYSSAPKILPEFQAKIANLAKEIAINTQVISNISSDFPEDEIYSSGLPQIAIFDSAGDLAPISSNLRGSYTLTPGKSLKVMLTATMANCSPRTFSSREVSNPNYAPISSSSDDVQKYFKDSTASLQDVDLLNSWITTAVNSIPASIPRASAETMDKYLPPISPDIKYIGSRMLQRLSAHVTWPECAQLQTTSPASNIGTSFNCSAHVYLFAPGLISDAGSKNVTITKLSNQPTKLSDKTSSKIPNKTIVCLKGKSVLKVSGTKPVCPAGYRLRT